MMLKLLTLLTLAVSIEGTYIQDEEDLESTSIKITPHFIEGPNKHENIIDRSINYESPEPFYWTEQVKSVLDGKQSTRYQDHQAHKRAVKKLYEPSVNSQDDYGKGHLGFAFQQILKNEGQLFWVGEILMGMTFRPINVVFDTGSDYLVVPDKKCESCVGNTFDGMRQGKAYGNATNYTRNYGSATLYGVERTDKVCLNPRYCVKDMPYYLFNEQRGLQYPIEGILGMSLDNPLLLDPTIQFNSSLFMKYLSDQRIVKKPIFSFYMKHINQGDSSVDIGNPQLAHIKNRNINQVRYLTMNKDFFWSNYLQGVAFMNTEAINSWAWPDGDHYAIFDTGSSHLLAPNSVYKLLIEFLVEKAGFPSYTIKDGFVITSCKAPWKPFYLMVSDYWIELLPEDYVYDVSENGDKSVCHLAILANKLDYWLLGLPFYQGYYAIHNMGEVMSDGFVTAPSVGFVPHVDSKKDFLKLGVLPSKILKTTVTNYIELYTIPIFLLLVILIYALIFYPWSERRWTVNNWKFFAFAAGYFMFWLLIFTFVVYPQMKKWSEKIYGDKTTDGAVLDGQEVRDSVQNEDFNTWQNTDQNFAQDGSGPSKIPDTPTTLLSMLPFALVALFFVQELRFASRARVSASARPQDNDAGVPLNQV